MSRAKVEIRGDGIPWFISVDGVEVQDTTRSAILEIDRHIPTLTLTYTCSEVVFDGVVEVRHVCPLREDLP